MDKFELIANLASAKRLELEKLLQENKYLELINERC